MNSRLAKIDSIDPLRVQFFGDTVDVGVDLVLSSYTPVVGDVVWMVELFEAQWMCAGGVRG